MPDAYFSEDQFECCLIYELSHVFGHGPHFFKPSRVLENSLGYDFATYTNFGRFSHRGISLDDNRLLLRPIQANALLPQRYVSAFIQCKRPFYVSSRRPETEHIWNRQGGPYYRFRIDRHQNNLLTQIERAIQGDALVRYAAPCFYTWDELDAFSANTTIASRTHFQSPSKLINHNLYTYQVPLRDGIAFSEYEFIKPAYFLKEIFKLGKGERIPLVLHISRIWQSFHKLDTDQRIVNLDRDKTTAKLALGPISDLPLDPFGLLTEYDWAEYNSSNDLSWDDNEMTLLSFATMLFAIQRIARDVLQANWYLSLF